MTLETLNTLCTFMKLLGCSTVWPVIATYADTALGEAKNTAALKYIPLGNTLYAPLVMHTAFASIYCAWCLLSVVATLAKTRKQIAIWTVPEFIFFSIFFTCLIMESRILPGPGRCINVQENHIFKAIAIANPSGDDNNLFTAHDACEDFKQAWQTAIAATVLSLIPLCVSCGRAYYGNNSGPNTDLLTKVLGWIFDGIFFCVGAILGPFVFVCFLCARAISSAWRRIFKRKPKKPKPSTGINLVSWNSRHGQRQSSAQDPSKIADLTQVVVQPVPIPGTAPLEQLLGVDDMFFSIAEFMCATDLHKLRASKTLNNIIQRHMTQSRGTLQRSICGGSRDTCHCCATPVCADCSTRRWFNSSERSFRQRNLDPVCSLCYLKSICFKQDRFARMTRNCRCTPKRAEYRVCLPCWVLNENELLARRDKLELKRPEAKDVEGKMDCFSCKKRIWTWSLRFWRCRLCRFEYPRGPMVGERLTSV